MDKKTSQLLTFLALLIWSSFVIVISLAKTGSNGNGLGWAVALGLALFFVYIGNFCPACEYYFTEHRHKTKEEDGRKYWILFSCLLIGSLIAFGISPHLAFFTFLIVPSFLFKSIPKPKSKAVAQKNVKTLEGRELKDYSSVKRVYDAARKEGDKGYYWGGIQIPSEEATTHFLVAGASGSGKTITLRFLMQSMLPKIQQGSNCRALIYDAKRDILSIIAGINNICPVWILNPFDERCVAWDIAKDITTYAQAESLASILVPKAEKEDEFFWSTTKQCLQGVVEVFMANGSGQWELRDIILAMRSQSTLKALLESSPDTEDCLEFFSNPATASSVMATIKTKMGSYRTIAALWHNAKSKISLTKWAESNAILVMGKDNEAKDALAALNQIVFTRVAQILLNKPEVQQPQNFIVLDELASLGKLNQLKELAEEGRSKGICLAVGFQSIKSLENVYNEKITAAITGQFRHKAFLRLDEPHTAEWASKLIGDAKIERKTEGVTRSSQGRSVTTGYQYETTRVVQESVFMSIDPINKERGQGLTGYYLGVDAYPLIYPIDVISNDLLPKSSMVKDFIPAPHSYQKLQDWTDEDLHRLGIYHILNPKLDDLYE
jgi:type IV secretory pathway TraG/TraD family ATPase VirD4